MELHQLRCFVVAAEQLHFGRAAQQLQMLPSALGRQIRLLEEDLGTRLFARTTRSVALTLANTQGKLLEVLQQVRRNTRVALLDSYTSIENYERRMVLQKRDDFGQGPSWHAARRTTEHDAPKSDDDGAVHGTHYGPFLVIWLPPAPPAASADAAA